MACSCSLADVPVHVDHQHIERHIVLVEAAHQLVQLLVAVSPVARPPRAEGKPRRQRNAPGHAHDNRQRLAVVVPVAEEVPVLIDPASFAGRSITHGHGLFSPSWKLKSAESNSGRVESSTSAHPERETSPGSIGSRVFVPRAPSRCASCLAGFRDRCRPDARRPACRRR